jgi:DNA-binding MarR family transcriptional regulator
MDSIQRSEKIYCMAPETLNEREFELVNIVGAQIANNQRDLSRHMDLSLGTINMLIRRLITKGFIRTKQLDQRKVDYMLTSKGFTEKTRKSVNYTLKTLNSISAIKESMKPIILKLYRQGERNFFVLGKSDFSYLVEFVLRENSVNDFKVSYLEELPNYELDGALLICKEDVGTNSYNLDNRIDLIQELAKDNQLMLNGSNQTNGSLA